MLQSDVAVLDELLSHDLMFTNHLGRLMSKQDDLDAHQSAALTISDISLTEQNISLFGDSAVVRVQSKIRGRFSGVESVNNFRFTRVWYKEPGKTWQVIVGHACVIN